jgi:hypothetical protein
MVSSSHEAMHRLFRDVPESVDQLFRGVGHTWFPDIVATEDLSGDVTEINPTERRADSVLKMRTKEGDEFVLIFESQRRRADEKLTRWPQYVTNLYDRHKLPVILVVICHDLATAVWAEQPISIGLDYWTSCEVTPLVLGPHNVPLREGPISEASLALAVLGVLTHGDQPEVAGILEPLAAALHKAPEGTRNDFALFVQHGLVEPIAARTWRNLMSFITVDEDTLRENPVFGRVVEGLEAKAEAKGVAEGKAEGVAEGKAEGVAESVLVVLDDRQIEVTEVQRERILAVHDREMLRRWLRAAMHVGTADELFG